MTPRLILYNVYHWEIYGNIKINWNRMVQETVVKVRAVALKPFCLNKVCYSENIYDVCTVLLCILVNIHLSSFHWCDGNGTFPDNVHILGDSYFQKSQTGIL